MTLTFELDLDSAKLNQDVRCLDKTSFSSKVIVWTYGRHTHQTDCSSWTTKVVGNDGAFSSVA